MSKSENPLNSLSVPAKRHNLKAGETLYRQGEPAGRLHVVISGQFRLVRRDQDGHELVLHSVRAQETLGDAALFAEHYHCDAIAVVASSVDVFDGQLLLAAFRQRPEAGEAFMAGLARQVMALRTRLEQRNIRSAGERILHYLALNTGADGCTVQLPGSLKDVAAELGLTHEALYRRLRDLQTSGRIDRNGSFITLKPVTPM